MSEPTASRRDSRLDSRLDRTRFTDIRRFATIDSTNRYLVDEAAAGAPEGLVAVADVQSAGRGRLGRTWSAASGGSLLVSVLLRPRLPPERLALVTMGAGLAAIDAARALAGVRARLKWPNDVVVDDRKLAGILAERSGDAVVVGMGLNLRRAMIAAELDRTATALDAHGEEVARDDLLVAWLRALEVRLRAPDAIVAAAREHSATLGRAVRVETAGGTFEAIATALTDAGHLIVRRADDGADAEVASADVIHLRPAD